MATPYITIGCPTTGGGVVLTGQDSFKIEGIPVACVGDKATCPLHKTVSTIISGDQYMKVQGKPMARAGDGLSCGCTLLPKQSLVVGDNAPSARANALTSQMSNNQQNTNNSLVDDKKEKEKTILCKPECLGKTIIFDTTPGPYTISMELWKFILSFEGFESTPYVPKNSDSSGVTLGYGYDLGQQSAAQIRKDLSPYYTAEQIDRLVSVAQGKKGAAARNVLPKISNITITKDKATEMIVSVKKRYANQVVDIYPEVLELHPHCQGALLDLIYNRGNGLKDMPKQLTRSHMREIRDAFKAGTPEKIPDILRNMSKLWVGKGLNGLVNRRKDEATWFEKGLKCDCYK
ncbi:pesticin C-terminus-like muramidase [Acinetobacter stercoris]|uniref:PAAR motif protein n=1 Tax=Acinetobacter stercoris TaxID=2126983 RepID=A0A2U3MWK3_9GAMM|nr:pesticin C-terminus-like muramidase [Acinetobacter stercoris]SPL69679.1 PAAR motif protein [Acinetobacter stercoris]